MFPLIDSEKAMATWGKLDPNGNIPDFSASCQSPPSNPKHNHECKQDYDSKKLLDKGWSLICPFGPWLDD